MFSYSMCSYISKIAAILTQFFKELHEMTDWAFTVLMGGPHPAAGGTLDVSSFHVGTTKLGNWFSQAYPQFSQNIMVPYTQFVERVFRQSLLLSTRYQTNTSFNSRRSRSVEGTKLDIIHSGHCFWIFVYCPITL